jgi:uncharacterized protein YqeY
MIEKLNEEIKVCMKNKNTQRLSVVRMLLSELKNEQKAVGKKRTSDEVVLSYLKKLQKAVQEFPTDKQEPLRQEIQIVEEFAPKQLSKEEVTKIIKNTFTEKPTIGAVMGFFKKEQKQIDGKLVKEVIDTWE